MVNSGVLSSIVKGVCGWVWMLFYGKYTGLDMAKTRKKYCGDEVLQSGVCFQKTVYCQYNCKFIVIMIVSYAWYFYFALYLTNLEVVGCILGW